jgi:chromosome segregation ATPase
MLTAADVVKFITDLGGFAGIAAVVVLIIKTITDSRDAKAKLANDALVLKAKVDDDALLAKAQVSKDALLAKAQVAKTAAETDEIIARASDVMVTGMQKRVDALILRIETSEKQLDERNKEIKNLEKRVEALEILLIKKDGDISKRDDRIVELESKVKEQALEIAHLQQQVSILEEAAAKLKL